MDILQKIREIYPSLTRKQKSIADYLLENPEDICYITLAQLSRQTCASELTLLRFCAKLGCSGFLELKQEFREHTQQMIRLLSAPAFFVPENASDSSAKTELLYELCRQEAGAAADFAASFQPEAIIAAAQEIRKSRRIFIFAHDISKVPGEFLKSRLLLLSFQVTMIDLADLEKTQEYKGVYHVLNGLISTSKGIMPEDINIESLIQRITPETEEVIIATNATVEGETTALYLDKLLSGKGVLVTRIAHGLPMGGHLDYADELTLIKAFEGRKKIQ